jgi:tRNA nucleotidyltransferase/poly(A) polymerase
MDKLKLGLEVLKKISDASFEAYIVGGAVRDFLMGNPVHDIDIATNAKPEDLITIFEEVDLTSVAYFSVKVIYKTVIFEVTTFRKDICYIDHRHPTIEIVPTLEEDLSRRDFTMNAIAMDKNQNIIDLYHGVLDIQHRQIKMIGNPELRFAEDGLRVLRAIEFSSRFNFTLEDQILDSFKTDYLAPIHEEYIITMLDKILSNPYDVGRTYLIQYTLLRSFPFYQVICEECQRYKYYAKPYALFYCIHHFIPCNLKLSNRIIKEAKEIGYLVRNSFSNEALFYGNLERVKESVQLYNILHKSFITEEDIKRRYENLPMHSAKELDINIELLEASKRGWIQKKLIKEILRGRVNNTLKDLTTLLEQENIG